VKINRETYEQVFIDYLEGNLTDVQLKELIVFLDNNPDLQQELKEITSYAKKDEEIETPKSFVKDSLKKTNLLQDDKSNFDELCIAFHENQLSEKQENILLEMIEKSPKLNKEFHLYANLKYKPDFSIIYPNKQQLLKKQRKILPAYFSYAASIILIVSFVFYWSSQDSKTIIEPKTEIAESSPYEQLNIGFSKKTEKKYQAIVSTKKPESFDKKKTIKQQIITKTILQAKQQEAILNPTSTTKELPIKNIKTRSENPTFKSYIAEFFQNIVGEDVYQQKKIKEQQQNNSLNPKIQQVPLSDNTAQFHYKKMILGSESEN